MASSGQVMPPIALQREHTGSSRVQDTFRERQASQAYSAWASVLIAATGALDFGGEGISGKDFHTNSKERVHLPTCMMKRFVAIRGWVGEETEITAEVVRFTTSEVDLV